MLRHDAVWDQLVHIQQIKGVVEICTRLDCGISKCHAVCHHGKRVDFTTQGTPIDVSHRNKDLLQ